jgi:hypothetical protein
VSAQYLLIRAILGPGLTTRSTSQLAVKDKILILQVLELLSTRLKTNLAKAVARQSSLLVRNRNTGASTNRWRNSGHTSEIAATIGQ